MIFNGREERFLESTKEILNGTTENLDRATKQRLENIRAKALSAFEDKPSSFFLPLRWIMFGGFATATMAAIGLFFLLNASPGDFPVRYIEDFEILTSQERIDFYQDLEFYRWMSTQVDATHRKAS